MALLLLSVRKIHGYLISSLNVHKKLYAVWKKVYFVFLPALLNAKICLLIEEHINNKFYSESSLNGNIVLERHFSLNINLHEAIELSELLWSFKTGNKCLTMETECKFEIIERKKWKKECHFYFFNHQNKQ